MERIDRPKFTLPEGDYFDTARIPELLAEARWAEDGSPKTVTLFWVPSVAWNFSPMSKDDEALLREIWKELPPPVLPMTLADWQPYADAFDSATARPEAGLRWHIDDPQFNVSMKRAVAKQEYQKILVEEIQNGSLQVRSEGTLAIIPAPASGSRKLLVTREVLKEFVERVGFEVAEKPEPKAAKARNLRDDAVKSYLRIIRALAAMGPIALDDNATKRVEGKLIELGFHKADSESDPGDETIRRTLKAASQLDPDYPPAP